MGRSKKIDDQKALELYRKGMLDLEIAKEFGCTNSAVTAWRATHNLPSNARGKKAPQEPTACKHENDVPSCDVCPDAPCNGLADEQAAMEAMADKLAGRKAAKVNPEWEKAVDEMVASNKPVIQPPTVEELLDVIDLLKRQRLVLIGIAIGAGVQDVWKQLEEAVR